ncbi:MAG TPA: helix-turn-helix domain-containing protein [Thermomicrobiaceae bacterium]|nr:helix-turn-helix domain-containing protein [Thermomicrobiaceae bacterium]
MASRAWLTLAETADVLHVAPRTIRRWVRAGTLPAELWPGRHGLEYRLPRAPVEELSGLRDLERPGPRVNPADVVAALSDYFVVREQQVARQEETWREDLRTFHELIQRSGADLLAARATVWDSVRDLEQTQRATEELAQQLRATRRQVQAERAERRRGRGLSTSGGDVGGQ